MKRLACRLCPALLLPLALTAAPGCHRPPPLAETPPPPVSVSKVVEDYVTDYEEFNGRTASSKKVDVTPRVTGYIEAIPFTSGDFVHKDQLLFRIDDSLYRADLEKAQGDVLVAKSAVAKTKNNYERELKIYKENPGATSEKKLNDLKEEYNQARGNLKIAEATVERNKKFVEWTEVRAPIAGKTSNNFLDVGNLVTQDKTVLTTVVAMDPIWVYFDVDERTMMRVKQLIREGKVRSRQPPGKDAAVRAAVQRFMAAWGLSQIRGGNAMPLLDRFVSAPFPVKMRLVEERGFPHQGVIDFVNNEVSPTTGSIRVRGVFPNKQYVITPGQFAYVRMPIGGRHKALLVSDRAIGQDQSRKFVYVVNDKNVVEERMVQIGQKHHGLRVIEKGLWPGERVIVSGLQRARAGGKVAPQPVTMPGYVRDEDWSIEDNGE